jgi:knotted carbamoyltransferase YgeW
VTADPTVVVEALAASENKLYNGDFLLTWDHDREQLEAVLAVAVLLEEMYRIHLSPRIFDSGLAVSIFRDKSTRTRFSFASAASLLGLSVQDFDETKTQVAHGETVRETANMISFLAEAVGIRDDMFLGEGHTYMAEVAAALDDGFRHGVLHQRPAVVNLQCDQDHPTQSLADLMHLTEVFGGLENLRGKRIAMTWAYSPSYGKPLSVPQGVVNLLTRFGMDVVLAQPEGYDLVPDLVLQAAGFAKASGGSFRVVHDMAEAFREADVVYPKSWAPFAVMRERTRLLRSGETAGLLALERECLANNARFQGWECTEDLMGLTRAGKALYMHCLPADVSGVNCKAGEVAGTVFDRYRFATYREAGHKPFVIAAMILLCRVAEPARAFAALRNRNRKRRVD